MLLRFFASRWLRRADFKTVPLCASTTPDGGLLRPTEGSLSRDCRGTVYDLAIHASVKQIGLLDHLTTLAYGVDYALVFVLMAMWSFRYRSLTRD